MNKRFVKSIIAGVLAGALAISIIPAENMYAESLYSAAEEPALSSADVPAPEVAEGDGTRDDEDRTAGESDRSEPSVFITDEQEKEDPSLRRPEDVADVYEENDDTELQVVTQFTEDYDHASGGIIPIIWNETDEAEIAAEREAFTEELVGAGELPQSYFTKARSGIRNQVSLRCWLHSLTTSCEISMIGAGLANELDYSERQMLYWYFNQTEGDTGVPTNADKNWQTSAGNYMMATAAVARHIGLADESTYPTDDGMENAVLDNNISHIEKVLFLGSWPVNESQWKGEAWNALTESVKAAVMTYGSATVTYYSGTTSLNRSTYGFYTPWPLSGTKKEADHSVTVIGWDDTKVVKAGVEPGAFYIQNSWSANSYLTQNGYNWISYYDSSLGTATCYVPEHEKVGTVRDEDVFFYTGTGYGGTLLSGVNRAGNIYTAEVDELIDSVGFYAPKASSYSVSVVTDLRDYSNPESGQVAASASGQTEGAGFFKVPLSKEVSVNAGDRFSVMISMHGLTDMTYRALFEGASADYRNTSCKEGQSFILVGSKYLDCGKDSVSVKKDGVTEKYSLKENFGNVCVYAYGNPKPVPQGPFPDVPYNHPYASAITWAVESGITKGYSDTGLFGLEDSCTRGQIMMFLWRYAGKPEPKASAKSPFTDVQKSHAFYKAILWGSQKGITKGYSNGKFGINDMCTRGQIMTFIWRYMGASSPKSTKNPFKDSITPAYLKAVIWAYENGITRGFSDGTYRDTKTCTRGEAVKFLHNMYTKL